MVARASDEVLYDERALIWLSNQTGVTFAMEQKRTVTDKLEKTQMMTNGGKMQQQQEQQERERKKQVPFWVMQCDIKASTIHTRAREKGKHTFKVALPGNERAR